MAAFYTALGGSNTCGHGVKKKEAFQEVVIEQLRNAHQRLANVILQPSCIPAMSPDYPASCLSYFAPPQTKFATLEFTPNMGDGDELARNTAHLEHMALTLLGRGARVVMISLVPRPPGCTTCIRTATAAHERVEKLAEHTGVPLITHRYDPRTWSDDYKHINQVGHREVADKVVASFLNEKLWQGIVRSSPWRDSATRSAPRSDDLPSCIFGADLESLVLPGSRGFSMAWSNGANTRNKDKPGLVATRPDALLRLCLHGLPASFGVSLALERSDALPMGNISLGCEAGCSCPLELLGNGDWTLHYRGRGTRRATENYMHRILGSRRGVANDGGGAGPSGCDCVLTLRNTPDQHEPFARAKINGLVAGGTRLIGWANRFHMGLNPNVLSG